jgi:hypothetical protein
LLVVSHKKHSLDSPSLDVPVPTPWQEPQLLGLGCIRLLPGIGDDELGGPAVCCAVLEGLDAGLSDTPQIFFEKGSQEDEVDQIPVAQVGPSVGGLLGDRMDLLSDLVAQRQARDALGGLRSGAMP